jgi:predicted nucleic acid-binding protein
MIADSGFVYAVFDRSDKNPYTHALDILEKYSDSRIDFVDACIMALAERLSITRILTFDHRDFGLYRPAHCEAFELLP